MVTFHGIVLGNLSLNPQNPKQFYVCFFSLVTLLLTVGLFFTAIYNLHLDRNSTIMARCGENSKCLLFSITQLKCNKSLKIKRHKLNFFDHLCLQYWGKRDRGSTSYIYTFTTSTSPPSSV